MKKKNFLKGCMIGFAIITVSIFSMYLGLSNYYKDRFGYNTWINGVYCTGKSLNEVNEELIKMCHYEGLTITDSSGKSYTIHPEDVGLTFDYTENLKAYMEKQNPYLWIDYLFKPGKEKQVEPKVTYDKELFADQLVTAGIFEEKPDKDRRFEISKDESGYYLLNERAHVMDVAIATKLATEAFEGFESELNLETEGCYRDLPLTDEMLETASLWEKLSQYQDCRIVYVFGEERVPIDSAVTCNFLLLDENGGFVYDETGALCTDEEKVYAYVDRLADEYDTVGTTRAFQTTRGDTVYVEGGIYGNLIDRKAEKEYLLWAFLERKEEEHEPAYLQTARKQGKNDIGTTYIEVDMTNQMLYYYQEGKLEIETPVVTGNMRLGRETPDGTNYVYAKQKNRVLRGRDYESFVKYWIPVKGAIGIHDASWRSNYGGDIYLTDGSHGCINTPLEEVSRLYEMVEIGTPCVMFY